MQTTIQLDDDLHAAVKRLAARRGRSMDAVVQDALRESPARQTDPQRRRIDLPVFHGTGVLPGVDIENSAALLDVMDDHHGSG